MYVYNIDDDMCREVTIKPNSKWGGEGSLGCGIGYGYLHRIPIRELPPEARPLFKMPITVNNIESTVTQSVDVIPAAAAPAGTDPKIPYVPPLLNTFPSLAPVINPVPNPSEAFNNYFPNLPPIGDGNVNPLQSFTTSMASSLPPVVPPSQPAVQQVAAQMQPPINPPVSIDSMLANNSNSNMISFDPIPPSNIPQYHPPTVFNPPPMHQQFTPYDPPQPIPQQQQTFQQFPSGIIPTYPQTNYSPTNVPFPMFTSTTVNTPISLPGMPPITVSASLPTQTIQQLTRITPTDN